MTEHDHNGRILLRDQKVVVREYLTRVGDKTPCRYFVGEITSVWEDQGAGVGVVMVRRLGTIEQHLTHPAHTIVLDDFHSNFTDPENLWYQMVMLHGR